MGVFKDFRDFALKGNIVDLATAVVIGGAFGTVITSFVNDILMPPIGILLGGKDFGELKYVMQEAVMDGSNVVQEAVTINYGAFIQTIINFTIIAFAIFMVIRTYQKTQKKQEVSAGPTSEELLAEIRDILKDK